MPPTPEKSSPSAFAALTRHLPPGQFLRYLVVGVWNTGFGYATFALFTHAFENVVPHSYLLASVLSGLLNITVSFLGYKWFVFKTKGNYLREWARCVMVYGSNILIGLAILPVLVYGIRHFSHYQRQAPYLAGAVLTALTVLVSFIGHRNFSFRVETEAKD